MPSPAYAAAKQVLSEHMGSMSFLEHLEELRRRIIWSFLFVAAGFMVSWWKAERIYGWMQKPIMEALRRHNLAEKLVYLSPTEPFNMYLKVGFIGGLFLASPFVLYQLWLFISPGLYRNERRYVIPFMVSSVGLFIAGGLFGYKMVYPAALDFLIGYGSQFQPMITIGEYTDLFLTIIIGLGIVFEMPILAFFLALMGIISAGFSLEESALFDSRDFYRRGDYHSHDRHHEHVHLCCAHGVAVHREHFHRLAGPPQAT